MRKFLKKRQTYGERQIISSFRNLLWESWSRRVDFGTIFGTFGAPWSPKVSQSWPEGSQKAPKSTKKVNFFGGCVTYGDLQKM